MTRDDILQEARELGFAAAGVAKAEPAGTIDRFDSWIAAGHAADMNYLARHRDLRADPRLLAPGAWSIIAVAARYPRHPEPGNGFSSYSWGRDYHDVVRERLRLLADRIGEKVPLQTARICVDSAPLLEREWATRAGIGWRGRQGQIVNRESGCCLVLGFLLVDIELPPTPLAEDMCGACRLCLDACPTGALRPDGTVDARLCTSYWTIEHRGPVPAEVTPLMGRSLFGCDRCTAVCPWNRFGADRVLHDFQPATPLPDADTCRNIADTDFERRFGNTAVHRIGPEGLRRNAAIAVANANRDTPSTDRNENKSDSPRRHRETEEK